MILILTNAADAHADHVAAKLRQRGAHVVRFDPATFPSDSRIGVAYDATGPVGMTLRTDAECLDLAAVTAVWHRRPGRPVADAAIVDGPTRAWVEEESEAFVQDVWECLDCRWLPAPRPVLRRAQQKAAQLRVAATLGFELPPTLIANDPDAVLAFFRTHGGQIVSKQAGFAWRREIDDFAIRYTEVVSTRDLGYVEATRFCPMIFQAYVPKRVELRVTVVADRVFAAEIHSQESHHTRHDWRRYDDARTRYAPHALPAEVEERCVALVERLGLAYGAIDLILTPDGRYVFLEINPSGQFLWIEQATGLAIGEAICDLLVAGREDGRSPGSRRCDGGLTRRPGVAMPG